MVRVEEEAFKVFDVLFVDLARAVSQVIFKQKYNNFRFDPQLLTLDRDFSLFPYNWMTTLWFNWNYRTPLNPNIMDLVLLMILINHPQSLLHGCTVSVTVQSIGAIHLTGGRMYCVRELSSSVLTCLLDSDTGSFYLVSTVSSLSRQISLLCRK